MVLYCFLKPQQQILPILSTVRFVSNITLISDRLLKMLFVPRSETIICGLEQDTRSHSFELEL